MESVSSDVGTFHHLQMIGTVVVYILIMVDIGNHSDQYCDEFGSKNHSVFNSSAAFKNTTQGFLQDSVH